MKNASDDQLGEISNIVNKNNFSLKSNQQYDYWLHYVNYIKKKHTDSVEKNRYYMKNFKEKIMIACLDVLSEVEEDEATMQKKFTNKCIELGKNVVDELKNQSIL